MNTLTNKDPALQIEDLTPNQPPAARPATIEVDDRDTFVKLLTGWHTRKVKVLEHTLQMPEGNEMQIGDEAPIKLEGEAMRAFKAGINFALMEIGKLPFAVEYEEEDTATPELPFDGTPA